MNEMKKIVWLALLVWICSAPIVFAQQVTYTRDQVIALSPEWKGERSADGRPIVPDNLLNRLKNISLEEAWGVLRNHGYNDQFEGDWMVLRPDQVLVGRALTVQYLPKRKDFDEVVRAKGKAENRVGNFNSWPIDMLKPGDIYVADSYGKIVDGTLIGDNLGNSIYTKSKTGVIFYGSVRDTEGLEKIEGFNAWIKGYDPSYIQEMMLGGINLPIRIGRATVLPGHLVDVDYWTSLVKTKKPMIEKGFANVPDAPGLGVELNEEVVKKHLDPGNSVYFAPTPEWDKDVSWDRLWS